LLPQCCGASPCPVIDNGAIGVGRNNLGALRTIAEDDGILAELWFTILALIGVDDPNFAPPALIPPTMQENVRSVFDYGQCFVNPVDLVARNVEECRDGESQNQCYQRLLEQQVYRLLLPANPAIPESNAQRASKAACRENLQIHMYISTLGHAATSMAYTQLLQERLLLYSRALHAMAQTPCLNPEDKYPTVREELDAFLEGDFSTKPRCWQYKKQLSAYLERDINFARLHVMGVNERKNHYDAVMDMAARPSFAGNAR
jgi:hypothetical protein